MISINIKKHTLGKTLVLENVHLEIQDGCIMGLVGINGAGKSTLLRLMSGVYIPEDGDISYDGRSPMDENTRKDIFFLPDDPYYTSQATCRSIFNMYKTFYPNIDEDIYHQLIGLYSLDEKKPIRNFSKGMRRQLYIAIALAVKPKYLLLDEAFDGLDPLSRKKFKEAIIDAVETNGTTVLISSHSLRELEDFCDKFAIIDNKTISTSGDITDKVESLCKFQLAFAEEVSERVFFGLPVVSFDKNGKFITIVLEGNANEMREMLLKLEPAVIDEMPMDFEEAFINEVEKGGK